MLKIVIVIIFIFNLLACEPVQQQAFKKDNQQHKINFTCLSTQTQCDIDSEFGRFTIQFSGQITQGRIKTELPFQIKLMLYRAKQGHKVTKVSSYLEGKSMFMGKVPVFFQLDEKSANITIADTLLASCSEDIMTWRLWFQIEMLVDNDKTKQQEFFIDFDSQRL